MSAKAIYEAKGKELLNKYLTDEAAKNRFAVVTETVNWDTLTADHPWLLTEVRFTCLPVFFLKLRYYKYFLIK